MEDKVNIQEVFEELSKDTLNPELVKDNKLHFRLEKILYRVIMPSQKILAEANLHKDLMQGKFIQQKGLFSIKKLKKILKENQEIDIDEIQNEIDKYEKDLLQLHISLAHRKDTDKKGIEELKNKINEVKEKRLTLVLEKTNYLSSSIQYKVQEEYYKYLTSQCTEKLVAESKEDAKEEKWEKVWNSFDEYQNDNSKIAYVAIGRLNELMLNV